MGAKSLMHVPLEKGGTYKMLSSHDSIPHITKYLLDTKGRPFKDRTEVEHFCGLPSDQRADFTRARMPVEPNPGTEVAAQA